MKIILCLAALAAFTSCFAQQEKDSIAIVKLLQKESATWRSGDAKAHAECWAIKPYSRILVSTGDSTVYDVPPQSMITPPPGMMGKGGTSVNTAYKLSIHGDNAWVSHNEESTSGDGKKLFRLRCACSKRLAANGNWLVNPFIFINCGNKWRMINLPARFNHNGSCVFKRKSSYDQ